LRAIQFDIQKHRLLGNKKGKTPFLCVWLGKEFRDHPELFTYYHALTRRFVVALWVNKAAGLFTDVKNLGYRIQAVTREDVEELRQRLRRPADPVVMTETLRREEYQEMRRETDREQLSWEKRQPRRVQVVGNYASN